MEETQAKLVVGSRLVVVTQVAHQAVGDQPTSISFQFNRHLKSDEQPYQRRCKVGEEWTSLDLGWIENAGYIVITNQEGVFTQVNPTEEERQIANQKVIWLRLGDSQHCWTIPPREAFMGSPAHASDLQIRCESGEARFTLTVFPS